VEGKTFDIVFLDKDMPIMSGPEVRYILNWCIVDLYLFHVIFYEH
jgi:hypothetical protein